MVMKNERGQMLPRQGEISEKTLLPENVGKRRVNNHGTDWVVMRILKSWHFSCYYHIPIEKVSENITLHFICNSYHCSFFLGGGVSEVLKVVQRIAYSNGSVLAKPTETTQKTSFQTKSIYGMASMPFLCNCFFLKLYHKIVSSEIT